MRLTQRELLLIRNYLLSRKMYEGATCPAGAVIWEPFMETLLQKVNDELEPLTTPNV